MGLRSGDAKRPEFVPLDRFPGFESVAAYPSRPWKHNSNRGEGHRRKSFFRRLLESFISGQKRVEEDVPERAAEERRVIAGPYW